MSTRSPFDANLERVKPSRVVKMAQTFTAFYESWLPKQEFFHKQLLLLSSTSSSSDEIHKESECKALVAEVLCHYQELHEEKSKAMRENPFVMLSPPWLSSYEKTLLWFGGFKPSTVCPLTQKALGKNLTDAQLPEIQMLRAETRIEEEGIEKEMASVQESVAAPQTLDLIKRRRFGGLVEDESSEVKDEEAMRNFRERFVEVLETADNLRGSTVTKLLEILSPYQAVKFLAAAVQSMIQTRKWGIEKDLARPDY